MTSLSGFMVLRWTRAVEKVLDAERVDEDADAE